MSGMGRGVNLISDKKTPSRVIHVTLAYLPFLALGSRLIDPAEVNWEPGKPVPSPKVATDFAIRANDLDHGPLPGARVVTVLRSDGILSGHLPAWARQRGTGTMDPAVPSGPKEPWATTRYSDG